VQLLGCRRDRVTHVDVYVEVWMGHHVLYNAGDLAPRDERIAFARRRLCLGPEYDAEIGVHLDQTADPRRKLVTLWWDSSS